MRSEITRKFTENIDLKLVNLLLTEETYMKFPFVNSLMFTLHRRREFGDNINAHVVLQVLRKDYDKADGKDTWQKNGDGSRVGFVLTMDPNAHFTFELHERIPVPMGRPF